MNFLGREAAKKQIKEAKAKLKANRQKIVTVTTEDFRASQSLKMKSRRIESDLFRAQKACRQLDMSKEFTEPVEIWFWPKTIAEAPGTILFTFNLEFVYNFLFSEKLTASKNHKKCRKYKKNFFLSNISHNNNQRLFFENVIRKSLQF